MDEDEDYILDASTYSHPVPLLLIAGPDRVFLNLKLPADQAIELVGRDMQNSMEINRAMIISNPAAYYMSLCKTLSSDYHIDQYMDFELVPGAIAKQQLN